VALLLLVLVHTALRGVTPLRVTHGEGRRTADLEIGTTTVELQQRQFTVSLVPGAVNDAGGVS